MQNGLRAGIVILGDKVLQLFHLCLYCGVCRFSGLQRSECRYEPHQLLVDAVRFLLRPPGVFCLKFLILCGFAPLFLCTFGVFPDLLCVKCVEIHNISSCCPNLLRKSNQLFQMLFFQGQQCDLLFQCLFPVKLRVFQNFSDILQ